jgi:hypothetical protein
MDVVTAVVTIVVALITGPVVVLLHKLRKENSEQHAENGILLRHIGRKLDKVAATLDHHIGWHEGKAENGPQK